tara:strand:+ start:11072 stop:15079 length:4008 start_codon:yes stop_codon:yes gene_type:complete
MLPLSTGNTQGCKPISSNCVVWQGPDLNCINVCNGDTISIIIAKMAELICTLIDTGLEANFDISGINQNCVINNPPSSDLQGLIQDIINTACNNLNNITNLQNTVNVLIEGIDDLELEQGPTGPAGPQGPSGESSVITNIQDNGNGTFTVTYQTGDVIVTEDISTIPGIQGPPGAPGDPGVPGAPGNPGNIKVRLPKCIISLLGTITDNNTGNILGENDTMFLQVQDATGVAIPNAYTESFTDGGTGAVTVYQYSGWVDLVTQKLCCLLDGRCADASVIGTTNGPNSPAVMVNDSAVRNLPIITQLRNRIIAVERKGAAVYTPPKILARFVTNRVGQRVEMHELLSALEIDYGNLRKAIGSSSEVLKASRQQCINLSASTRLSGNGVMSTLPGWNNSPSNLSEAFSNAWKTICDMRTAVETLQSTVTPSGCTGFVYDPKISLSKDVSGNVTGIKFLFTEMKIPEGYSDSDKTKGTKIIIEDSSLNTFVKYANISNLQNSATGFTISNLSTSGLDVTSNFKVKIEFAFTDGSNLCERIMEFTLENTSACPTVTLATTGETAITYNITGLNTSSKSTYEIIVEDQSGSMMSKQTISQPSSITSSGKASGLIAGTNYDIYVKVTSLAGNVSTCDRITFKTSAPTCTSYSYVSTDYKTTAADLGSTTKTVATFKSGTITTAWIAGFDATTLLPCAYKGTDSTATGVDDSFVVNTTPISDNPTTSISCGNVAYPATGMTTLMNSNENGWQYLDALTKSGVTYYIYALVNTANKSIDQIVFCCDCKPSYVRTKYGSTSTISTSEAYLPDRHSWYAVSGQDLRIPIDIVGHSKQSTPIKWSASAALGGSTKFLLSSDKDYDSALGGTAQLIYTPSAGRPTAGIDSIDVYAETDCTIGNPGNRTINTVTIPINDANLISNIDTDITVFIDTNIITLSEAEIIKTEFDRVKTVIQSTCSTWTGTVNYVPITGSNTGDYLEHTKAMVDMKAGGTGSVTVSNGYTTVKSLPAYWTPGSSSSIPSTVSIVSFIGDVNGKGNYGGASLTNGWGVQPTAKYQQNYDELLDILYINGTTRTAWGASNGCTYKKFDLKQTIIPVVTGSQDNSAAAVLQVAGAVTGTVLSSTGLKGFPTGSVKNPINIDQYIGPKSSQMVPYNGTTVGGSNTIIGLYNYGFRILPFIDKSYLETDSNIYSGGDQSNFVGDAIKRLIGIDSSGMGLSKDSKCPTNTDSVQLMSGTLNGSVVSTYGNDAGDPTNCTKAGNVGTSAASCVPLYNSTGVEFDPSVPAYVTVSGGNVNAVTAQPVDGAYYAQQGPAAQNAVRRAAQYDRDGASTGAYWVNVKVVAAC